MTDLIRSWVDGANAADCPFPLNNLPYGVFSVGETLPRCGIAIGTKVLDATALEAMGILTPADNPVLNQPGWNGFMALGQQAWADYRADLGKLLAEGSDRRDEIEIHLYDLAEVTLHMPFQVAEYTDFYAGKHHAMNIGTILRGAENALPPNWLHIPIGYNGRASSVVVSGSDVKRPWGQVKTPQDDAPRFAPSARFDIELELGAIVGQPSSGRVSVDQADAMIFGYVLLNDWSARDIQGWEYAPLGPFQAKATATTISPWIVPAAALTPFRCATPTREVPLLPHLQDTDPMLYDIDMAVDLDTGAGPHEIARVNYNVMYYSSAQQLAHHTSSGCPMRVGDLLGSGTISGEQKTSRGSLMELTWAGQEPLELPDGQTRTFLQDGDTVTLRGQCHGQGYTIGFGACVGRILPADPA